ncbi:hypothetical protein [Nocardioides massiliensis]|uniref:Pantothenate kinase n=1 Tax=Nocardioides massiliensis TaxID=1325935 RepID=A0ABT9NKW3_9ACTN|nr:hypothetical protein [Nocardioides massiliensis]MDP9821067.1 pantothenate kinase [Nocardioides massiliensis]
MTNTAATEKGAKSATPATNGEAEAFDRNEMSRLFSRVRAEVSTVVQDAEKKRPLFSRDRETAVAKRNAVMKALESFIDMVDQAKREA